MSKDAEDYARLSLLAGFMIGRADAFLGHNHFKARGQENTWCLTWDMLAAWKAEAFALGVPFEEMEPDDRLQRLMPDMVKHAMRLQQLVDRDKLH